jgi:hypothetical protein
MIKLTDIYNIYKRYKEIEYYTNCCCSCTNFIPCFTEDGFCKLEIEDKKGCICDNLEKLKDFDAKKCKNHILNIEYKLSLKKIIKDYFKLENYYKN